MPKKTKREKIQAEKRRHLSYVASSTPLSQNKPATIVSPQTFTFQTSDTTPAYHDVASDRQELTIIRHDLLKTIILAIIAIGIELGIYWYITVK